ALVLLPRSVLCRAAAIALIGHGSQYAPPGPRTVPQGAPAVGLPIDVPQYFANESRTTGIALMNVLLEAALETDAHRNAHGNGHCNAACKNRQKKLGRNAKTLREQNCRQSSEENRPFFLSRPL